ncbi:MAG: D-glycerate dehydrogenase, partial [Calditrichia bacterium]|nr:D-glycerate dehydrogenase [Calditrichia bacterium]
GIDLLIENGFDVDVYTEDKPIPIKVLLEKVENIDALLPLLTDSISAEIIEKGNKLKIIANYAAGFNNIDLEAATVREIVVTNTPGVLTEATADLTWALIMAVSKRIVEGDEFTRAGKFTGWGPLLFLGGEITGKTLGIVGAGRIGTAVAQRAFGFNMNILYTDGNKNDIIENKLKGKKVELDELLKNSNFISLHVPLTERTFHLIDKEEFQKMKNTAYMINTSRGPVINESALVNALQNNQIAGAGLDVYENEPELKEDLIRLKNTVLLPHIGSATLEARTKMAIMAATNIISYFEGKKPPNIINPEIL